MRDVSLEELGHLLGRTRLNLLRRGADGSLRLSADRWRLSEVQPAAVVFHSDHGSDDAERQTLSVPVAELLRVTWDQLPRQRTRSQLRFHLANGDLWTFSGEITAPDAPSGS